MISSAILALAASPLAVLASIGSTNTTIDTTSGKVQGVPSEYVSSDITVFRGIPFAASTAGNNRWKAPQDPTKWNGTKIMSTFGPSCPQSSTTDTTSEDCLSLNIWLPPGTNTNSSLPVYLWIYGGLEAAGASDLPVYDGAGLANKGVIQIGANYRKGIFGYLALSELTAESSYNSSGNYGFLDHIKALEWIRDNIANFGGDPQHLTIGGQSAGSAATQQLLYSPLSQGLFSSAIIQSGVHDPYDPTTATVASNYVPSLAIAEAGGLSVAQNISAPTLSQLRNLSMDTLVEAQSNYTSYEGSSLWAVNLDGYVIAHTYYEGLLDSSLADVPILTGNVKDENGVSLSGVSLETYQEYVTENYGNLTEQVYALYPATDNTSATTAYNTLIRDNTKVTTYLWSKLWNTHRTSALYSYFWVHGQPIADAASQGAFHGSEMNYVFDTLGPVYGQDPGAVANWTTEDYQLADKMSTLWANFIKSHSPNAGNLTGWGVSALNATMTYQLGQNTTMIQLVDDDKKISLIEEWYAQSTRVY